jgi:hypothetical protein
LEPNTCRISNRQYLNTVENCSSIAAIRNTRNGRLRRCAPGCERAALVSAYIETIVPEGFRRLTIEDFSGEVTTAGGKAIRVLRKDVTATAREQIVKYCWKGIEPGEPYHRGEWGQKSIMDQRREEGTNVVIYGNASNVKQGKLHRVPVGKTMIASIVMKEAIHRKFYRGHLADKFEWVQFPTLVKRLLGQAKGEKSYDDEIDDWEEADWLVVDGITFNDKTESARSFRASVLDQLFIERVEKRLPTIFVFQDDIEKCDDYKAEFGVAIANILSSRKTFRICVHASQD